MTTRNFYTLLACVCLSLWGLNANAQEAPSSSSYSYTPEHMWEVGIGLGHTMIVGDQDYKPGFGGALHVRRALDYIFSLRGEVGFQGPNAERLGVTGDRVESSTSTFIYGSLSAVITLNNFRWDRSTAEKKWGPYVYAGVGAGTATGEGTLSDGTTRNLWSTREDSAIIPAAFGGAGLSYKISPKVNIGIDHQVGIPFGREADLIDGYENTNEQRTTYRDLLNFTTLRLAFNLGDKDKKSEPLYWINPLEGVAKNLEDLNARPVFDLTDTDGDGVIDMIDQEKDTPANAAVDTRGMALDSDGDGVKDYEDQEPYSMPGFSVDGKGVAQVPTYTTKDQVDAAIDAKLKNYQPVGQSTTSTIADWFMPMVHFNNDSYSIRYSDYPNLKAVANIMKNNPGIRVLVKGYTDKTSNDRYNTKLSYNRAKSAIEHLIQNYGIARDRLVLNYGGEENNLVPSSGSSLMNRRVEFSVAGGESEMGEPEGRAGKGTFGGSRNAGY